MMLIFAFVNLLKKQMEEHPRQHARDAYRKLQRKTRKTSAPIGPTNKRIIRVHLSEYFNLLIELEQISTASDIRIEEAKR